MTATATPQNAAAGTRHGSSIGQPLTGGTAPSR